MAIYHLAARPVRRSKGQSTVAAAAYRAATQLTDERTGVVHDYRRKAGVTHREIVGITLEREALWNTAEAVERQRNGCTGREYEIGLPVDLNQDQRRMAAQEFAEWLHQRHGVAVDLCIHDDNPGNPHAHVLTSTRVVGDDGASLAGKAPVEWSDKRRSEHGLPARKTELNATREAWAEIANAALTSAAAVARIDHRTLAAQGIDRDATIHEGAGCRRIEERSGEDEPVTDRRAYNSAITDLNEYRAEREQLDAEEAAEAVQTPEPMPEVRQGGKLAERIDVSRVPSLSPEAVSRAPAAETASADLSYLFDGPMPPPAADTAPEPVAEQKSEPEPESEPTPEPQSEPDSEPEPEFLAENADDVDDSDPMVEPEPTPEPDPIPEPERVPESDPEPEPEPLIVTEARAFAESSRQRAIAYAQDEMHRTPDAAGATALGVAVVTLRDAADDMERRAADQAPRSERPRVPKIDEACRDVTDTLSVPFKRGGRIHRATRRETTEKRQNTSARADQQRRIAGQRRAEADDAKRARRWWRPSTRRAARGAEARATEVDREAVRLERELVRLDRMIERVDQYLAGDRIREQIEAKAAESVEQSQSAAASWDDGRARCDAVAAPYIDTARELRERADALENRAIPVSDALDPDRAGWVQARQEAENHELDRAFDDDQPRRRGPDMSP